MSPAPSVRAAAWALALGLTCCLGTSRPSRFYTLQPVEVRERPPPIAPELTLAVGPVELPDYIDRPQIVTRSGSNELLIAEFERWGGALDRQIDGALVRALREPLAPRAISVVPQRSVIRSATPYRVAVSVTRFDGTPGQSVVLQARWELRVRREGKEDSLEVRDESVVEGIEGSGYDALVAAMQRAVVRLGQQMAEGLVASRQLARTP